MRTIDIMRAQRTLARAPAIPNVGEPIDVATWAFAREAREVLTRVVAQLEHAHPILGPGPTLDESALTPPAKPTVLLPIRAAAVSDVHTPRSRGRWVVGERVRFRPRVRYVGEPARPHRPGVGATIVGFSRPDGVMPGCVYIVADGNRPSSREGVHRDFLERLAPGEAP